MDSEHIIAGGRTVQDVSSHFDSLKSAAQTLLSGFDASQRGYFTPSEDEETRHLLLSYWQSRNALVKLVQSFHADMQRRGWEPASARR